MVLPWDEKAVVERGQVLVSELIISCYVIGLVLEGAYEATMWAAVLNAQRGVSNVVLLTSVGGGAFGNDKSWIHAAMRRALDMMLGV
jgi:hypothetical protein